jgi:hypothetical protein
MGIDSIPAEWETSITSPVILYWRGLEHLAREWERTKSFASAETDIDALLEYLFWRKNLVIWACCAIEAFANEVGVSWLGESFYKQNLERLGICEKVAILYALKYGKRLAEADETLRAVRTLFDFRNRLVHPKTRNVREADDSTDEMRTNLDRVSPEELRKVFWRVSGLFEPKGIGETT